VKLVDIQIFAYFDFITNKYQKCRSYSVHAYRHESHINRQVERHISFETVSSLTTAVGH